MMLKSLHKIKRGDFNVNNFASIVLAVIVIAGLVFLAVKLATFFVGLDMKNAKAFIDDISAKIETLNEGESNTFALRGVDGWVLVGWNKEVPMVKSGETIGINKKPQKCFDKSCLCLCEGEIARCQESGYCKVIDRKISVESVGLINLELIYSDVNPDYYSNISASCYSKFNPLDPIFVSKSKEEVNISVNYGIIDEDEKYGILISKLQSCGNYVSAVDNSYKNSFKVSKN